MKNIEYYAHNRSILHIAITVLAIGIYSIYIALREQVDHHSGLRRMILLATFVFDNHPNVKNVSSVVSGFSLERDSRELARDTAAFFEIERRRYVESGQAPLLSDSPKATIFEFIAYLVAAPICSLLFSVIIFLEIKRNRHLIIHSEYRKNFFSRFAVIMAIQLLIAYWAFAFLLPTDPELANTLIRTFIGGTLLAMVGMGLLTQQQRLWKTYWTGKLDDIIGEARHVKNDSIENNARNNIQEVKEEPDVPISMSIAYVTAVYTGATAVTMVVASLLNWT